MIIRALGLLALLIAGLVGDHFIAHGGAEVAPASLPVVSALAPHGALASTWYCPGLGAEPDSPIRGRIIVGNPSGGDVHATLTFIPKPGRIVVKDVVVPAFSRTTFRLEDEDPAPLTATLVSIDGDAGGVEQEIQGSLGESIAPCATTASDHWYFASGRTDTGAATVLSLYNPFPGDAIADVRFATDQGPTTPGAYQGLVIPGHGILVLNVGERVRLRTAISTTIALRSGRVVADKLEVQNGSAVQGSTPYHGLALTLGDPAPATTWYFADGVKAPGVTEHFDVYNPGTVDAHVEVSAVLEQGSADPFELVVPPGDRSTVQVDRESRIPASVGQAWTVAATDGVPFVVERQYEELAPAPRVGVADCMGSPRTSTRWLFPAGSAATGSDEYLIVFNPGARAAQVTVSGSGNAEAQRLPGLNPLTVPGGQRQAIRVSDVDHSGVVQLDVSSDVPVLAERAQARVTGSGVSGCIGIGGSTHGS